MVEGQLQQANLFHFHAVFSSSRMDLSGWLAHFSELVYRPMTTREQTRDEGRRTYRPPPPAALA